MTYFSFLAVFILVPVLILVIFSFWERRNGKFRQIPKLGFAIGIHILLALLYTTPWDNYLVATRVWYYNPKLISGIVLGYVPLEEYTFFILETLLAGLWWRILANRAKVLGDFKPSRRIRSGPVIIAIIIWLGAAFFLQSQWKSTTYLSIILFWALPAMIPQLAFGADILWHQRRLIASTVLPMGLYLSFADSLAIRSGTWTINPAQSTGIFIGSLPLEEGFFFLITVTLISFGITLLMAKESQSRAGKIKEALKRFAGRVSHPNPRPDY